MILHIFTQTVVDGEPEDVIRMAGETLDRLREYATVETLTIHAGDLPEWVEGHTRFRRDPETGEVWLEVEDGIPTLSADELRRLAAQALGEAQRLDIAQGKSDQANTTARRVMAEWGQR